MEQFEETYKNEIVEKLKLMAELGGDIKKPPKSPKPPRPLPAELLNELFASLPFENAFVLLTSLPNAHLAKNVCRMLKNTKIEIKANKWNVRDCGPKLSISENGRVVKHLGTKMFFNSVRAQFPIEAFNAFGQNSSFVYYFCVQIVHQGNDWQGIGIGFCGKKFRLKEKLLGNERNSIGIWSKNGIWIEGCYSEFIGNGDKNKGEFKVGDMIGIGLMRFSENLPIKCFGTANGKLLGLPIELPTNFYGSQWQLFQAVNFCYPGASIRTNCQSWHG